MILSILSTCNDYISLVEEESHGILLLFVFISLKCSYFQRQDQDMRKMERLHISHDEMTDVASYLPKDKRAEFVHQEYLEVEAKLMEIVDKLPKVDISVES